MMLRPGEEPIPGYKLQKFLGKGQFGEVWKTTSPGKTNAALKFLDLSGKQGWKEFRGIQHVKRIRHANLMPITALWLLDDEGNVLSDDAIDNMVTDTTTGTIRETAVPSATVSESVVPRLLVVANLLGEKNLLEVMKEHKENGEQGIPVDQLLNFMEDAAKGIDFLNSPKHNLGQGPVAVQHCDIKPENILLVGDSVMVCDFGVARVLEAGISATATGMVGSPAYMAPECIEQKPSLASDQYSLALSYAELRQGELPFSDKTYPGVIKAHQTSTFDFSGITEPERQVLKKATAKKPSDRFETSIEMVRAMRRAVEGDASPQHSPSKGIMAAALIAAAIAVGLCAYFMDGPETVDNGGGTPPPVVDKLNDLELRFSNSITGIHIDGEWTEVAAGKLAIQRKDGDSVRIELPDSDRFHKVDATISVADFVDGQTLIEVLEKGSYYAKKADENLAQGDFDEAVNAYAKAVEIDSNEFAVVPQPVLQLDQFSDAQIRIIESGMKLAIGSRKGEIVIFDLDSGEKSNQFDFQQSTEALSISDSHYAFRVSKSEVSVRPFREGASSRRLKTKGDTFELLLSPNGRRLVGRAYEATSNGIEFPDEIAPEFWDLSGSSVQGQNITNDMEMWSSLSWTPDSSHLVGAIDLDEENIRIWSFQDNRVEKVFSTEFRDGSITSVAFTPDSHFAVFAGEGSLDDSVDETVEASLESNIHRAAIFDFRTQTAMSLPSGHGDVIEAVAMSDGRIATGDASGNIHVWEGSGDATAESESWQRVGDVKEFDIGVAHLKFFNNGEHLISASKNQIMIHRANTMKYSIPIADDNILLSKIEVSADGRWLVALGQKGTVLVWDLQRCLLIYEACLQTGESYHFEPRSQQLPNDENISRSQQSIPNNV